MSIHQKQALFSNKMIKGNQLSEAIQHIFNKQVAKKEQDTSDKNFQRDQMSVEKSEEEKNGQQFDMNGMFSVENEDDNSMNKFHYKNNFNDNES